MLLENSYASFVNLKHRTDRLTHMNEQLANAGIEAERFEAIKTFDHQWDKRWNKMMMRTPGAIGCYVSQMEVIKKAKEKKKHAFVMEDDLVFSSDLKDRIAYIEKFLENNQWDIMWLGGTVHINQPWWYNFRNNEIPQRGFYKDAECTSDPRIMRTYACFCTYAYIVRYGSIDYVLSKLEEQIPESIGIDFSMIKIQPDLLTYALLPGSVKQIDNLSDIGTGITKFSGFSKLGEYWWQDKMEDFDPSKFDFAECKI